MRHSLVVDARWLVGGIGTYTRHLLKGLHANCDGVQVHAITRDQHKQELEGFCARVSVVDVPIYTLQEQWAVPRAAVGCDLLHVPHYNAPLLPTSPLLVTIHDIIHITDPDYRNSLKSMLYAKPLLALVARKAAHIVTDSDFSKSQIVEHLGVPESKVTRIYCGVNGQFHNLCRDEAFTKVSDSLAVSRPYFLYVGSLKRYKNVSTLLKAFAILCERRSIPHQLLIVGDDRRLGPVLRRQAESAGISNRTKFVSYVDAELLPSIYAAADALVMPSRIEGFGLPVLEAMSCGTPVICSRAASLPEVGGDAVLYFDPGSVDELSHALERLVDSPQIWNDLRKKGLDRSGAFTWEESTRQHLQVYEQVLADSRNIRR